jgi:hypothetical protein
MLPRIPKKYGHFIFGIIQSGITCAVATGKSPKLLGDVLARIMDDNGADRPVSSAVDPSNHRTCYL